MVVCTGKTPHGQGFWCDGIAAIAVLFVVLLSFVGFVRVSSRIL